MALDTSSPLVEALRGGPLLTETQRTELTKVLPRCPDTRTLARHLIERDWLTSYQANCLLQGRGADLVLGPYVLLERLGEGGNGQVFKARHQAMNRLVALKVLRKELASDAEIVGRFHREMEVLSHISHPHLVHAFDAGPIGPHLVLAMEYVDGSDLARRVQKSGPLPVPEAAEYIRQAAAGLQHAHERGLIHRDIKPANLLVSKPASAPANGQTATLAGATTLRVELPPWAVDFGVVKILDLGLARLRHPESKSATANLTLDYGTTVMNGTPDYMAPEQALDFHTADIRADIYSLGCTLFFLLTGKPPFPGNSLAQKLMKHQQAEPPDIRQLRPDVPEGLAKVLYKMLAKKPGSRYQTPGAVADALTALLTSKALSAAAVGKATVLPSKKPLGRRLTAPIITAVRPWLRRLKIALAGLVLVALMLLVLRVAGPMLFNSGPTADQRAMQAVLELLNHPEMDEDKLLRRLREFHHEYPALREPFREELLALRRRQPGSAPAFQAGIWLTYLASPLDRLDAQQIPEKKRFPNQPAELVAVVSDAGPSYTRVTGVKFRPDCKMLAYCGASLNEVHLADLGGAVPKMRPPLRGHASYLMALDFSPDGQWVATGGGDNSAKGDNKIRLWGVTQPDIKADIVFTGHGSSVNTVAFAPDGRWLVSSGEDRSVRAWEVSGSGTGHVLVPQTCYVQSLAFSPDGGTLAIAGTYTEVVQLMEFKPPQPGKITNVKNSASTHTLHVAFAPDKPLLAMTGGEQIVLWDTAKQAEAGRLKGHTAGVRDFVFSPDGTTLFSGEVSDAGTPDGRLLRWDVAKRELAGEWRIPCGGIMRVALASDGRHLIVGGRNSMVYILRLGPPRVGK